MEDKATESQDTRNEFEYHYSREDRLNSKHINTNERKRCFLCRKNIQAVILLIDLLLVIGVVVLYNFMVGRSKAVNHDGALYFYSKKIFGNFDTQNFVFQIKNNGKKTAQIKSTAATITVYDVYGEIQYEDTFQITKTSVEPKESFIHTISFNKLPKGRYLTKLTLNNDPSIVFEMYYNSK